MKRLTKFTLASLLVALTLNMIEAQQLTATAITFVGPEEMIKVRVTFEGQSLNDIANVFFTIQKTDGSVTPDKAGFDTGANSGESKNIAPGVFELTLKVPENLATGDYLMMTVWTNFKTPSRPTANFPLSDRQMLRFHIRNPRHFENPEVKSVVEVH